MRANTCPGNRGLFQPVEVFEDAQRSRRERMLRECVCCCTLYFSFCFCRPFIIMPHVFSSLVVFVLFSLFGNRYLGGIENKNECSEVVVDLARELTDLGLDPQMFLLTKEKEIKKQGKKKRGKK